MESNTSIEVLVARKWDGSEWRYYNIEQMVEENKLLRAELASMKKKRDRAIKQCDKANENLREACKLISSHHYRWTRKWPWEIAAERGWKCFKKGSGA